ncbi:MAG TPA: metallophosphoesterase [Verrucomicrobiae bacterium]|nr:metallophosphoesterase [Verrucomicrobiae bacterium]
MGKRKCYWWFAALFLLMVCLENKAAGPFFFIQLTDPQFGMFADNTNFAQETANVEFAVSTINRLRPAFVVVTGDLVNRVGDIAQIKEYKRIFARVDPAIRVYNVAGNHDVGNVPTPESVAAYTNQFGPDHYAFRHDGLVGIVLDSSLIKAPQNVPDLFVAQENWLKSELQRAEDSGARHIVIFQHYPWFLQNAGEPEQYFNLPRERRTVYLGLFREFGVEAVFCGHYHRNTVVHDGSLEIVTTGALGKPLGGSQSGIQIVIVRDHAIEHRFYNLGEIPSQINLSLHNSDSGNSPN